MATGFPEPIRQLIIERAGYCCERCGRYAEGGSIHHRRPRKMGGSRNPVTNSAVNGVLLCGSGTTGCHGDVESNRLQAIEDGWIVPAHADPTLIPIHRVNLGPVYLDGNGFYLDEPSTMQEAR